MKYIKVLGLSAFAAMALMAVVGAGTASATELCSTTTTPCSGTKYSSGTHIEASVVGKATLTNSITNVTCEASTVEGETTSSGGSGATVVTGTISELTFENCETAGGTSCTVATQGFPAMADVQYLSGDNGSMTVTPEGHGEPGAHVTCGFFINCTFTTSSITLDVLGGSPAHVTASEEVLNRSGGFCPSTAKWDATYEVTSPNPLFVV